jgi:lipopolysaccharide transport system ATP-binding protein
MGQLAIKVENIGKKYVLSRQQQSSDSAIGALANSVKNMASRTKKIKEDFWALKDISFEINQGDRVGIIGRNGAGKSTLLKILSRIVKPTTGRIEYYGRMASLLEVGTGFHGDLTGRENIYLNGSILGMSRKEIDLKFDEIVAFSEVEQFLDTPVKRYSSGMYVRLAFAVAAHLEPEILIVDEVLAVGDSIFQKKCIDRMGEIAKNGKTIIFVSHSFGNIKALCDKAILLETGKLSSMGDVDSVFKDYLKTSPLINRAFDLEHLERHEYERGLIFRRIEFNELPLPFGKKIVFYISLKTVNSDKKYNELDFGINFCDSNYQTVYHLSNRFLNVNFNHENDNARYYFEIENNLKPGIYNLILFIRSNDVIQDFLINRISIEVADGNPYGFNDTKQIQGVTLPNFNIYRQ